MSEDIDERIAELLTLTERLVEKVTAFTKKQKNYTEQQNKFAEEQEITSSKLHEEIKAILKKNKSQEEFEARQKMTSEQLHDEIRVILDQNKKDEEFRNETNENFAKLRDENKIINRKVEWSTTTSLDADKRVEALEVRVAQLEQKIAA